LQECLRLLELHASLVPPEISISAQRLRTLGVAQVVELYDLLFGSRRSEVNHEKTLVLLEEQQRETLEHLTAVAVWLQDSVPNVAMDERKTNNELQDARQTMVGIWEEALQEQLSPQYFSSTSRSSSLPKRMSTSRVLDRQTTASPSPLLQPLFPFDESVVIRTTGHTDTAPDRNRNLASSTMWTVGVQYHSPDPLSATGAVNSSETGSVASIPGFPARFIPSVLGLKRGHTIAVHRAFFPPQLLPAALNLDLGLPHRSASTSTALDVFASDLPSTADPTCHTSLLAHPHLPGLPTPQATMPSTQASSPKRPPLAVQPAKSLSGTLHPPTYGETLVCVQSLFISELRV